MNETYRKTRNHIIERNDTERNTMFEEEIQFYDHMKMGDLDFVTKKINMLKRDNIPQVYGVLSDNNLRNIKYHAIAMITLAARFCMEGGLDVTLAYELADSYICQVDTANTPVELGKLSEKIAIDFTKRMRRMITEKIYSQNVVKAIDYIHNNIYEKVTTEMVAQFCGLHPSYLSRLFKEEVRMGVSEYIRHEKIDTAKSILKHTDETYAQIAQNLAFSSQSHFGKVFRELTGMTPKEYRDQNYHRSLGEEEDV